MSFRKEPIELQDRVASTEEAVRRIRHDLALAGIDVAGIGGVAASLAIIEQKGDVIVGNALGRPSRLPVGPPGTVLTADPAADDGVSWGSGAADVALLAWLAMGAQ